MKLQKDFFENIFPAKLRNFESLLKERNEGKGFFLGDEVSVRWTSVFHKEDYSPRVCSRWLETFYSRAVSHEREGRRGGGRCGSCRLRRKGRGRGKEKRKRGPRFSSPLHLPSDACHTHCTCNIMIINVLSCLVLSWASSSNNEFSDFYEFWSS